MPCLPRREIYLIPLERSLEEKTKESTFFLKKQETTVVQESKLRQVGEVKEKFRGSDKVVEVR